MDRKCDVGVRSFASSYDDMMSLAQRMSSNRSLGEPSILESPAEKQPGKNHRGRPKSTKQMRGRGRSAQRNKNTRDTYESSGELSGAETSQNSRKSKNSRLVASRLRKIEHEKRKKERMHERSKTPQDRSRSLDRRYSRGDHKQCQGKVAARIVPKNKSGITRLLQSKMDRLANCLGRSAAGSTHIMSGSLSTADSRSTRHSRQSWDCRKSLESGPSKKSTKSLSSPKMRIMRSGTILSAAADIFQHQCIQVSVDAAVMLDDEASCNSSLSCYSENTSDSDNFGYFQSISVAY
ncbi:hypothetical protein HJC23_001364 [Cyclotella cryptica]|uniref:Uncharacterized protein n=1 Tax=Cyclotella cryptica TaxID=29204 RepID=A0ABD3PQH6_9STRA|eukprot:CCRYP_013156-RA/>CCRYP_013156-RA protein AED:0.35 eAED:0.35 QI:0/-1/0/1/-1/1/1/0/292